MPIRVKCEKCKKTLSVKDHLAGKKIKCPLCQTVVAVPLSAPTKEPPAAAQEDIGAAKKPVPPAGAKKPAAAGKPILKSKPAAPKPDSNGTPTSNGEKTNGKVPPPPAPIELPPENVEEEALSALTDEPPPPEEVAAPQTIDFKCNWCDEELKLPIELGGKQTQCPNAECKRIIKVPMPKAPQKKDWRKMERQGPAAAKINLPEALDNAWGTEEATQARQGSLAHAGIGVAEKPPVGITGWLRRGFYAVCFGVFLFVGGLVLAGLLRSNRQVVAIKDIEILVKEGHACKITDPLLRAEAYRTIALYHLHGSDPKAALAKKNFQGARSYIGISEVAPPPDQPLLHEQFFLVDLALAQIDTGGAGDIVIEKKRLEWGKTQEEIQATLLKIKTPEIQVIAVRELAARLNLKGRREMAIALAGGLSGNSENSKRPPAYRQQIALLIWDDKLEQQLKGVEEPKAAELEEPGSGDRRVGFAEGYARKGKYDEAMKLADLAGPENDRLDAYIGIAAVALQEKDKNKEPAGKAFKAALSLAKNPRTVPSPWHWLELARLAARLDEAEALKEILDKLVRPQFKLRAHLEVFLAKCDKSATPIDAVELGALDAANVKDRIPLALAWTALARQHARTGGNGLKAFEKYKQTSTNLTAEDFDLLRPMVDIGLYQGLLK